MARPQPSPHAFIVDEENFALVTELELRKALRLQYPVSVLAVLAEPIHDGANALSPDLADQLARVIGLVLRGTDLIRRPAVSSDLHVLLVDADLGDTDAVTRRIREEVSRHRFELDGEPTALLLSLGGACFPTTARTTEDLLAQATAVAEDAHRGRHADSS